MKTTLLKPVTLALLALLSQSGIIARAVTVTNIAAGLQHNLLLKSDGSFWGMGQNTEGELGDGTANNGFAPVLILSNGVVAMAGGGFHSLFLKSDGSLWGMGYNAQGELGDGTFVNRYTSEEIVSNGVVAIAGGDHHSLFVKSDGSLWGMGYNGQGQLGANGFTYRDTPFEIVSNGVVAVAGGDEHSLFLKSDGSLWGMGNNAQGELGDGTTNNRYAPEEIVSNGVAAISTRYETSFFVKTNGSLWGMGNNSSGQLGIGTTVNATSPVEIVSNGVAAVGAGGNHGIFLKSDGSLWGMGYNYDGQLGLGSFTIETNTPAEIVASNVTAIAVGFANTHFLTRDGTLWAMGRDFEGELGDGAGLTGLGYDTIPELINAVTFAFTPPSGAEPLTVQFASPGADFYGAPLTAWNWNFGDGASGTGQSPLHTYLKSGSYQAISGLNGSYQASLIATNNLGATVIGAAPPVTVLPNFGLVVNGGFETGDFTGWNFPSGQAGASVTTNSTYVHSGAFGAQLGPTSISYLSQTLTTTPGATYTLSFWLNGSGNPNQFLVSWNGTTVMNLTNASLTGWTNFQFAVTATAASTVLEFGYDNGPSYFGLDDITVFSPVAAAVDVTNGPFPLKVHFSSPGQDANGLTITNWDWNFGDGTPNSTLQNPTHTYFQIGAFLPSLLAENNAGGFASWSGPAITVTLPTLQFTASPTNGVAPFSVQFTSPPVDSGGSAIANWSWNFGDGTPTSAAQSPAHIYAVQGTFMPTLQADDSNGALVVVSGPAVVQSAGLASNDSFETGTNGVVADWSLSSGFPEILQGYAHSGTNSLLFNGGTAAQNIATQPGTGYLVSFWIYNYDYTVFQRSGLPLGGFSASWDGSPLFSQSITNLRVGVWTNIQCYAVAAGTNAALQFQSWSQCNVYLDDVSVTPAEVEPATVTPSNGPINLTVQFNAPATDTAGQTIAAWDWDFGDGSPHSSAQNPSHTYASVGTFSVVLSATNSGGTAAPGSALFVTTILPTVQVTASPTNGPAPLAVQFTAAATDNTGLALTNWNWTFDDGTTGSGPAPLHTYYTDSGKGAFQPTLIATNSAGIQVLSAVPPVSVTYNPGLMTNGGFETGTFAGWTAVGDVNISGTPYSGSDSAQFGITFGGLSQTISTTPGAGYRLEFVLSNRGTDNGLAVWWNGTMIFGPTNSISSQWTNLTFFVLATNTDSTLQFVFTPNTGSYSEFVDDVSLLPAEIEPFTAAPTSGALPLMVQFNSSPTDSAGQTITNWDWDFGDGSPPGSGQNPAHTYTHSGTFVPVLTAMTSGDAMVPGASGPLIVTRDILFTATPASGPAPLIVQFGSPSVDSNGRTITNWFWTFGDGGTSTAQNPTHIYQGVATFTPTLAATNNAGDALLGIGPAIAVNSGIISNGGFESGDFSGWSFPNGQSGAGVYADTAHSGNFGAYLGLGSFETMTQTLATTAGETYLLSFWLQGHGGGINGPVNQFQAQWGGNVLLSITNTPLYAWTNFQFAVTASSTNTVLEFDFDNVPNFFGLDDVSALPAVQFTASPTNGTAPVTVQFNGPAVDPAGTTITNWSWEFGDGGYSAAQNPAHAYAIPGIYQPLLNTLNAAGLAEMGIGPAAILVAPGLHSNLVTDGGFETGTFSGWNFPSGQNGASISTSTSYVHSGTYGAQLGPTSISYLSQTLFTTPGAAYTLSFWLRNNSGANNLFLVSWNGNTLLALTNLPAGAWSNYVVTVTASSSGTVLEFGYDNGPSYFGLDDISVLPAVVAAPVLTIGSLSGNQLQISWPTAANMELQTTTNLAAGNGGWTTSGYSITTANGTNSITVTPTTGNLFFRLKQ